MLLVNILATLSSGGRPDGVGGVGALVGAETQRRQEELEEENKIKNQLLDSISRLIGCEVITVFNFLFFSLRHSHALKWRMIA